MALTKPCRLRCLRFLSFYLPGWDEVRAKLHRSVAVTDLETTGTSVDVDQIVEIGILKVTPDGELHRFRKRVRAVLRSED
jgi:DNA polymerase III epsilon subunit-like protein